MKTVIPPGSIVTPFVIGEAGRAAREMPPGAPVVPTDVPDSEVSAASVGGILFQGASVRGLQHRATGSCRQDAFALGSADVDGGPERAVAVVCDGVGALGLSHLAAKTVSHRLAALAGAGWPWPDAFAEANQRLIARAQRALANGGEPDENGMATTAVAVVVHREGDDWVGDAAWVGDSSLWHLSPSGEWTLLTGGPGEDGDAEDSIHSTAVRPLPSSDGACRALAFRCGPGALFLMTDGVGNPLKWSSEVRDALYGWWRDAPDMYTFAAQVAFGRRSHFDDRTVVGLWPLFDPGATPDVDARPELDGRLELDGPAGTWGDRP